LQDGATRVLGVLSPLDAPWLWLALAMAAGWLVRKRRELLALVAAGVAGQLAIALTSADAAPAQVTWLAATVLIAAIAHRWSS
jgi:MYXO-CTERM domain-containing protein